HLQLPGVLDRPVDLDQWHLDANHRPGMAGLETDQLAGGAGHSNPAAIPTDHVVDTVRRRPGRSCTQARTDILHAKHRGPSVVATRRAGSSKPCTVEGPRRFA